MRPERWLYGSPGTSDTNQRGKNPLIGRPVGFHTSAIGWSHAPNEGSAYHGFEAVVIDCSFLDGSGIYWIVAEVTKVPEDGPLPKHMRENVGIGEIILVPIGGDTAVRTLENERRHAAMERRAERIEGKPR